MRMWPDDPNKYDYDVDATLTAARDATRTSEPLLHIFNRS